MSKDLTKGDLSFGIIGYGAFGEQVAHILSPHARVVVSSRREIPVYDLPHNVTVGSVNDVATCDVVILCNELSALDENCKQLTNLVLPSTIVMDVCSVKQRPALILQKRLGGKCKLLATHPLFGPQTAPIGRTNGKKMVWHEVSGGPFPELERFFAGTLGLNIIKMSPEDHDKQMAWVHCLTFFVGRGLMELNPPDSELTTNYYERLLSVVNLEKQHSYELFRTVQLGNFFSGKIRKELILKLQELDEQLLEDHI